MRVELEKFGIVVNIHILILLNYALFLELTLEIFPITQVSAINICSRFPSEHYEFMQFDSFLFSSSIILVTFHLLSF